MTRKTLLIPLSVILLLLFLLYPFSVRARSCWMRHDGAKVTVGDSVADVISQFGEPKFKLDLGELDDDWRKCRVELWVYEFFPWRYELRIGQGRILRLDKIRLRKVR